MQWNRLVVNLWSKMSLFCSMKEGVSYLFLSATTYLLFCHVQPPPRSTVPHVCCRPSNGRKMQALTAVEWFTAVRYETDGRLANGWTDGLPENRLTGLGAGLPLTRTKWGFIVMCKSLLHSNRLPLYFVYLYTRCSRSLYRPEFNPLSHVLCVLQRDRLFSDSTCNVEKPAKRLGVF